MGDVRHNGSTNAVLCQAPFPSERAFRWRTGPGCGGQTVQEKAIAHPADARLTHRAIEKLVDLGRSEGVDPRRSYLRTDGSAAARTRTSSSALGGS